MRLHPAASRIKLLAVETPAPSSSGISLRGRRRLAARPFVERRARLEALVAARAPPVHVTPATSDRALAADWFARFEGAGFDGVMAKPRDGSYAPDKRTMLKIKHARECDAVVAGFRWHKGGDESASARCCSASTTTRACCITSASRQLHRRRCGELVATWRRIARMRSLDHPWRAEWAEEESAPATSACRAAQSRWSHGKDLSWKPLRPELVVRSGVRITCKARAFGTRRSSGAGGPTSRPARLYLCAAGGRGAAGAGADLRHRQTLKLSRGVHDLWRSHRSLQQRRRRGSSNSSATFSISIPLTPVTAG